MTEKISIRPAKRDSNLELFRCITMLLIVAHHYVVNSGLILADSPVWEKPCSWRSIFLLIFGAWGKTGINCFVLITGYYMCKSAITTRKFFRLLAEIWFYRIAITLIFVATGYEPLTKNIFLNLLPFAKIDRNFSGCFILFYLFIPFLTILVQNMTKRQHLLLILLVLFIYTVVEPIPWVVVPMNYVSWFIVLFFIASFLRMHMDEFMLLENSIWTIGSGIILLLIDIATILIITWLFGQGVLHSRWVYYFVGESNRLLPLLTSIMAFIVFKKIHMQYIPIINIMGSSTFAVFLIHSRMRHWLWYDFLHNVKMYGCPWLVVHAVGSVLAIFVVCIVIDRLRICFIEPPMLACFNKLCTSVLRHFNRLEDWLATKTRNLIGE